MFSITPSHLSLDKDGTAQSATSVLSPTVSSTYTTIQFMRAV